MTAMDVDLKNINQALYPLNTSTYMSIRVGEKSINHENHVPFRPKWLKQCVTNYRDKQLLPTFFKNFAGRLIKYR